MFHNGNQGIDNYIRPNKTSIYKRRSTAKRKYINSLHNPYMP